MFLQQFIFQRKLLNISYHALCNCYCNIHGMSCSFSYCFALFFRNTFPHWSHSDFLKYHLDCMNYLYSLNNINPLLNIWFEILSPILKIAFHFFYYFICYAVTFYFSIVLFVYFCVLYLYFWFHN